MNDVPPGRGGRNTATGRQSEPAAEPVRSAPSSWPLIVLFLLALLLASALFLWLQTLFGTALGAGDGDSAQWVQFGPALAIAAVVVYRRCTGLESEDLRSGVRTGRGTWQRAAVGVGCGAAGMIVWLVLMRVFGLTDSLFTPIDEGWALPTVLVWTVLGSFGEELGWRGFLQPQLQGRFGFWAGTVATGLLWGAWHIQVFGEGAIYALGFLANTVALSFLMAFLIGRGTVGAVWIAGSVHAAVDLAGYLHGPGSGDGAGQVWLQAIVFGGVAAAAGLLTYRFGGPERRG